MSNSKYDFTKTMRNVFVSDEPRNKSRSRENWTVGVELAVEDKHRLNAFMRQELAYYNALITAFSSRARSFPEHLLALHDSWQKIFAQIAMEGRSIKNLLNAEEDAPLSEGLEPYRRWLLGRDAEGNRFLDERMVGILDVAASAGSIHSMVRRNIAIELLNFYKTQAEIFASSPTKANSEDVYRTAAKNLETVDVQKKRHLQIPRTICKVVYDETSDRSAILHPYCRNPIIIPHINMVEEKWTMIILHQEPGSVSKASTPWCIDIKSTTNLYLINYMDVLNPNRNSAFVEGKKKAFT